MQWRYCGLYDYKDDEPAIGRWLSEKTAQRRYHDPTKDLTIVPPADPSTGFVPYYISVTTAEYPSFKATILTPPGLTTESGKEIKVGAPHQEILWKNCQDGRLFCFRAVIYEYPPVNMMPTPDTMWAIARTQIDKNEDGTGHLQSWSQTEPDNLLTADMGDFDVNELYSPFPEWGHWDELLRD